MCMIAVFSQVMVLVFCVLQPFGVHSQGWKQKPYFVHVTAHNTIYAFHIFTSSSLLLL
jgi:hypothetical protein